MKNKYILITAARNEEKLIGDTIESVLSQTVKPELWIIVNDNSSDKTQSIVERYAKTNAFIKIINDTKSKNRDFASKVFALNMALDILKGEDFDYIGILDADITFRKDYYEDMLKEFDKDPRLGLAGGEFFDIVKGKKIRVIKSSQSVRGGIQLFRKESFEEIGRFTPLKYGGEDVIMEVLVRKNGWKVKSFEHQMLEHHRLTGTGGWGILEAKFREGILAYTMGYHPAFQIIKSIHRQLERPFIIAGVLHFLGFAFAYLKGEKRPVSEEFINFLRGEQLQRLKNFKF